MNKRNRGILIGMALGDGHIYCKKDKRSNSFNAGISFTHSIKQKAYIEYKADLLHSIFGGKRPKITKIDNNGYPGFRMVKGNKYFRFLRKKLYKGNKKYISEQVLNWLTPHGLAIWWMDDGSLSMKRRNGKIHARAGWLNTYLSLEENNLIANIILKKFGVKFIPNKSKGMYRLYINTTNLKRLISIIDKFVIPSMFYKIDMQYENTSARHPITTNIG